MKLEINYPFKPYIITQHWGNPNPAYSNQFNDTNFKLHNGVDANVGRTGSIEYQTQFPVYCPVEGFTVMQVDFAPKGGGNELWLISDESLEMFEKTVHALIPLCHAKKIFVKAGDKPKVGELLMMANNTGFSTGPHTHMGLYRVDYNGHSFTKLDTNQAEGSFSPELFFNGKYAVDVADVSTLVKNGLTLFRYYSGTL